MSALAYLRLLRAGTLFSPAADVVAGLCLAGLPIGAGGARAAAASVCVYAAGMVLNDHADRKRDAVHRPERPIPAGEITAGAALGLGVVLLAAGIALSPWSPFHATLAALVLAYNYAVKHNHWAGALNMGLLRGLNLAAGPIVLTLASPPREVWIAAAVYACYIVAVTVVGILEDERQVRHRTAESVQLVPPIAAALALLGMPHPWPAAAIGGVLALLFVLRVTRVPQWDRGSLRASMTWLLLGTMVYTGLLCMSAHRFVESFAVLAAILPARWIARRIALT